MAEVRVYRAADDLATNFAELLCPVAKSHNLSGAHKCEVQGVEEQHHILPCRRRQSQGHTESGELSGLVFKLYKVVVTQDDWMYSL